jgi:hypothetical protein
MELIMYHIVEVTDQKQEEEFLRLPALLYKAEEDEKWVGALYRDTERFFNRQKNLLLKEGDAKRWLLYDVNKHLIGRIAAFYWNFPLAKEKKPTGYFGFFECTEDQKGALHLFKAAADWLESKGMKTMQGPFHLGGPGFFTGSLSRGFFEPVYGMPYNFAFYNDLFLAAGFEIATTVETYRISLENNARWNFIGKKAQTFYQESRYRIETFEPKNFEKFIGDFTAIFNTVWSDFPGMAIMTEQRIRNRFSIMKPFLIKKTILMAYFDDEPVAFLVAVPNVQHLLKQFKGYYNFLERIYLWFFARVWKRVLELSGLLYAVVPEHKSKGVEPALLYTLYEMIQLNNLKYKELIMNRIGDFEPDMKKVVQQLDGKLYHQFITYQITIDKWKNGLPEIK